jgi:hypothetical protein
LIGPIRDAFKTFDLDRRNIGDWYTLVFHLAHVVFPRPRQSGRPRKWNDERLCKLLADVAVLKRKHPKASDTAICGWLKEKWNETPPRLRRVLLMARNPKHNTALAMVVSILKHHPGADVTVSSVIARADEFWPS